MTGVDGAVMAEDDHPIDYEKKFEKQKQLLENQYEFPCDYIFKFIIPRDKEEEVRALFPDNEPAIRPSNKGNYLSLTITYHVESSDLVLAIYEKASTIKGLIAL